MFKKFGIGVLAVVLAVAFSAFSPVKKTTAAKSSSPMLFWYTVVNGVVPQGADYETYAEESNVPHDCDQSQLEIDCLRGFEEELDTSEGDRNDTPQGQIKKNDPNTP